jgi:lipopolysaccharide transport system permease protein
MLDGNGRRGGAAAAAIIFGGAARRALLRRDMTDEARTLPLHHRPAFPAGQATLWDLVWTLVRIDFKSRYHGTAGGFLWALLKPLTMFLVLMSVFAFLFGADASYRLRLIIGLFLFDFFSVGTMVGLMSLNAHGYLLSKARFPAWVVVVTSISNPLVTMLILASAVVGVEVAAGALRNVTLLVLFASYLVSYVLIVIGFSLATSILFLKFRDLNQIWEVVLQAGFFLAPIFYPLHIIPERYQFYLYLWPPTPIIQFARMVLVDHRAPTLTAHLCLLVETVVVFGMGVIVFNRFSRRAPELL